MKGINKKLNKYNKSPLNYVGNKYKLLQQIVPLFPDDINTFVDLFCGGCDVCTNITANEIFANDINQYVISIYKTFQQYNYDDLYNEINNIISKYKLSKTNKDGYIKLRDHYNINKTNYIELFTLICYSFNNNIRFNKNFDYNCSFGMNRSSFNEVIQEHLKIFLESIQYITFSSMSYQDFDISFLGDGDFLYADPPYLISRATYNDGNRGYKAWSADDDIYLFAMLDDLNSRGCKFALSNVFEHKGEKNEPLIGWSRQYSVHHLNKNYDYCIYVKNRAAENFTDEVLITNY